MSLLSKEQFEKIYDKALTMCSIKCKNKYVRDAIKMFRDTNTNIKELKELKPQLRRNYWGMNCYECRCSPDFDYMYKLYCQLEEKQK